MCICYVNVFLKFFEELATESNPEKANEVDAKDPQGKQVIITLRICLFKWQVNWWFNTNPPFLEIYFIFRCPIIIAYFCHQYGCHNLGQLFSDVLCAVWNTGSSFFHSFEWMLFHPWSLVALEMDACIGCFPWMFSCIGTPRPWVFFLNPLLVGHSTAIMLP